MDIAIETNNLPLLRDAINKLLNNGDTISLSFLLQAIKLYNLDIIKELIYYGVDVNGDNNAALILAVQLEQYVIISDTSDTNNLKYSNKMDIIEYLVESGADVTAQNNLAIIIAANDMDLELIMFLEDYGADLSAQNNSVLLIASQNGDLELIKYLIKNDINPVIPDNLPLIYAVTNGYLDVVIYLLLHNASLQIGDPLIIAIQNGHLDITRYLVTMGANIHVDNDSPLILSVINGHYYITHYLIGIGANIHAQNDYLLILSAGQGNLDMLKILIKIYDDFNNSMPNLESVTNFLMSTSHIFKETALYIAAKRGQFLIIKYLIEDLGLGYLKSEALVISSSNGYLEIVKYLIQTGANIHFNDNMPLIESALHRHIRVVKYLIKNGADITAQNYKVLEIMSQVVDNDNEYHDMVGYLLYNINKNFVFETIDNIQNIYIDETKGNALKTQFNLPMDTSDKKLYHYILNIINEKEKIKRENIDKCHNSTTLIMDEPVKDIHPLFFYMIKENDKLYCGDIRDFVKYRRNPLTRTVLGSEILKDYAIIKSLFKTIDTDTIDTHIVATVRSQILKGLDGLPHIDIDLYINADDILIDKFIDQLYHYEIINNINYQSLQLVNGEPKKLMLATLLIDILEYDRDNNPGDWISGYYLTALRVTLGDIYRATFNF
jgi:ankyrin repeat protein